jgi:hypothetical protein
MQTLTRPTKPLLIVHSMVTGNQAFSIDTATQMAMSLDRVPAFVQYVSR